MYLEIAQRQLKPFPHVKEGLIWLKECNFQMAVATSSFKQAVTVALTTTGLIDFFDIIVSADDVERHKPHPDSYLKAVENLRIPPQLSYAIEDSASGIKAAKTAGLFTIGVMNSFEKTILHEADLILADTISAIGWILNKYANNELIVVSHLGVCIGYLSGIIAFIATVSYVVVQVLQVMDVLTNPLDEILIYGTSLCI
jgi:HAD superfamily hydrolase (TIGR01509 family)